MKKQLLFPLLLFLSAGSSLLSQSEKKQPTTPTIILYPGSTRIFLGKQVTVLSNNATVEPAGRWQKGQWRVKPLPEALGPVEVTVSVKQ